MTWHDLAACAGQTHLMFGPYGEQPGPQQDHRIDAALALCAVCDVKDRCREASAGEAQHGGIWGGLVPTSARQGARFAGPPIRHTTQCVVCSGMFLPPQRGRPPIVCSERCADARAAQRRRLAYHS